MCVHQRYKSVCTNAQSDHSLSLINNGPLATLRALTEDYDRLSLINNGPLATLRALTEDYDRLSLINNGPLATLRAHTEDSDQTARMYRLI